MPELLVPGAEEGIAITGGFIFKSRASMTQSGTNLAQIWRHSLDKVNIKSAERQNHNDTLVTGFGLSTAVIIFMLKRR